MYDRRTLAPNKQALLQQLFVDGPAAKLPPAPPVGPHPVFAEADLTTTTTEPPTTEPPSTEAPASTTAPPAEGAPAAEPPPSSQNPG
jgi:hypothetical protein